MTVTLSKQALASNRASVEDCLRACGAQLWPRAALRQYQAEQEKKVQAAHLALFRGRITGRLSMFCTLLVAAIAAIAAFNTSLWAGATIFGWYLCARVIFHLGEWPTWQTNELLKGDLYWRDGLQQRLPAPAQKVVDGVRVLFADTHFAVSFVGHDPVLHVFLNGRSYNALVWDVNADGTIEILSPAG
jgi:hypothetical protein